MNPNSITTKIETLSPQLQKEVLDFVEFLLTKEKAKTPIKKRAFGSGKGMFIMSDDFDEPLEDFNEYMQ